MHRIITKLSTSYTFTGDARQATFGIDADSAVLRLKRSNMRIVRARLIPSGAGGLAPAVEKIAAKIQCKLVSGNYKSPAFALLFTKWDEWEALNIGIGIEDHMDSPCDLMIIASGTEFTCDDYNVADAYVGQAVTPILELELECDGIIPIA